MTLLCNRSAIHCSDIDPTLQRAAAHGRKVIAADFHFVRLHKPPELQIQSEHLAKSVYIDTYGWYESLGGAVVVLKIASISWYP
jgi:hypothetical protein